MNISLIATFSDMQQEFDVLRNIVEPAVENLAFSGKDEPGAYKVILVGSPCGNLAAVEKLLESPDLDRAYFYVRNLEADDGLEIPKALRESDAVKIQKLDALKKRITEAAGKRCKDYRAIWDGRQIVGLGDFAQMVEADIRGFLKKEVK